MMKALMSIKLKTLFKRAITIDSSFESKVKSYWQKNIDDYGFNFLCSCDCDGIASFLDSINTNSYLLPTPLSNLQLIFSDSLTCVEMTSLLKPECNISISFDPIQFIDSLITISDTISLEEKNLIISAVNDMSNGTFDVNVYRILHSNLQGTSSVNNMYSYYAIEMMNIAHDFIEHSGNTFPPPNTDPPTTAAIYKLEWAVGLAHVRMFTKAFFTYHDCVNNGYDERCDLDFGEVWVNGFITGMSR